MKKDKQESRNQYIKDRAVEVGSIDGHEYWVVPSSVSIGLVGYNGYVVFPERPVREEGYSGILTYVPVHGGITYAEEDKLGMVYGFDTAHYNSDSKPRNDCSWIKSQCRIMLDGILKAKEVERNYLRCTSNRGKAKYAQMVQDINPDIGEQHNFLVTLNLLSGKL